jgi:hypothetical protein
MEKTLTVAAPEKSDMNWDMNFPKNAQVMPRRVPA